MPPVSMRCVALIPVDARPVVREQVVQLVATAGCELLVPPLDMLGHFRQPADREALADWVLAQAENVDGFVISLDMLVYGGLVASRFTDDRLESLLDRLGVINVLKQRHPHKPVYAFVATMRISNNNVAEEEKSYWSDYGELIWRWSYFTDKFSIDGDQESRIQAQEAESKIPADIRTDYLATRARNFAVAKSALALCRDEGINRLVVPQDDTAQYGFNIAERRALEALVREMQIEKWVRIYAGADEVAHTLCAHLINALCASPPLKVHCIYSDPLNIANLTARYEDRPILESLEFQLAAVDAVTVDTVEAADVVIGVHTQGSAQGDWAMRITLPERSGIRDEWFAALASAHLSGKPVALLDLAYANGGDPVMLQALTRALPLRELAGYAGWNTASNSIGGLVAQCSLARAAFRRPENQRVLCLRLLEDYLYQSVWRQTVRRAIDEPSMTPEALQETVASTFIPAANQWLSEQQFAFRVESIHLPWQRTFEIGINLSERPA